MNNLQKSIIYELKQLSEFIKILSFMTNLSNNKKKKEIKNRDSGETIITLM